MPYFLLCFALLTGHHECVDLLIDEGGNVNGVNPYYGTPLHAACGESSKECASSLISSGQFNGEFRGHIQTLLIPPPPPPLNSSSMILYSLYLIYIKLLPFCFSYLSAFIQELIS